MAKTLFEFFLTGLFFGSGPCLSSCGPILISYVAGNKKSVIGSLVVYTVFSCSRIAVYLILSLAIFLFGEFTTTNLLGKMSGYIFIIGGVFMIVIGIFMAFGKTYQGQLCRFFKEKFIEHDKKSVAALGLLVGLLPCAPFLAVLSYTALVSKTWMASLLNSFSFGMGTFISPLLLIVLALGIFPKIDIFKRPWFSKLISLISAGIMVFLGLRLIFLAK